MNPDLEWQRQLDINARRGHDLTRPSDPERVRRHLDGAPDVRDGKPRCPVCGVTGYRMARRGPDSTEMVFWCRKGHPHYVQSFKPNDRTSDFPYFVKQGPFK